ncbi:MAG: TetR/AcrR family transcriptional regulator [Renibacterium salmoninarum]|nr:TetR/AcrR family transcriptional regulator [Renibacterium salmoninarum]
MMQDQNRREKNKTATRGAIAEAALDLLRTKGMGGFTVENVADAAGVSRRTFFNYFPSAEAAIASSTESFLDLAIEQFRERPLDEPILEAAQNALIALADPMHLATIAEVYSLAGQHDAVGRFQLEIWNDCTDKIIAAAKPRFSASTDELYVRALVGSVIACGKAAMEVWFARNGAAIDETSLRDLRALMIRSIAHLGAGFVRPEQ